VRGRGPEGEPACASSNDGRHALRPRGAGDAEPRRIEHLSLSGEPCGDDVRALLEIVAEHRAEDVRPFDVVLVNHERPDAARMAELGAAGATWWLQLASARGWPTCRTRRAARHNDLMSDGEAITAEGLEALEGAGAPGGRSAPRHGEAHHGRASWATPENAEYHSPRTRRIWRPRSRPGRAPAQRGRRRRAADATVELRLTVTVADEETGREATYTLVGPTRADLSAGKLG
jgi:hypothetical protein